MLMRRARTVCVAALALTLLLTPRTVRANTGPIPDADYPAHMLITYEPSESNQDMDCKWNFKCPDGFGIPLEPLFHSVSQDELHRLDGWLQSAQLSGKRGLMLFYVFLSHYDPSTDLNGQAWVNLAFRDLGYVAHSYGYVPMVHRPHLLPVGDSGKVLARERHISSFDSILLACRTGSTEVEALAIYDHGSSRKRKVALHDLVLQVQASLTALPVPAHSRGALG